MVALFTVTVGFAFTEMVTTAELGAPQPLFEEPVTEYVVVIAGVTVKLFPEILYVSAPLGVITTLLPSQIVAPLTTTVGVVLTDTVDIAGFEDTQLLVPVPVTEYAVVAVGDTVKLPPVIVYVFAPLCAITAELPEQISGLLTITVGLAFTDTVIAAVLPDTQLFVPVPVTEYEVVVFGVTVKLPPVMV